VNGMPTDLADWSSRQTDQVIQNIASRGLLLSREEIRSVLSKMGETMSMRKLHRKIAIMAFVLELDEGDTCTTGQIAYGAMRFCRPQSSITKDMVGGIMRIIAKWGYVSIVVSNLERWPSNIYRRTALE